MTPFVWTKLNGSDAAFVEEKGESVRGKKEGLTLGWMEPVAAAAALFVCVSSVQWSHQEASDVCEAILSQRIPSPSSKHIFPSPLLLSSLFLHPPL